MAWQDIARGVIGGVAGAAGDTQTKAEMDTLNQQARQRRSEQLQLQAAPLVQAINESKARLQMLIDPSGKVDAQGKPMAIPGKEKELDAALQQTAGYFGQIRTLMGDKEPSANPNWIQNASGHILRALHLPAAKGQGAKREAWEQTGNRMAYNTAVGAYQGNDAAQQEIESRVRLGQPRDKATADVLEEMDVKGGLEPKASAVGNWVMTPGKLKDGTHVTLWHNTKDNSFTDANGAAMTPEQMSGFTPDPKQTKAVSGGLVKSKQSPTGWAKTFVDPFNPSKIVGWTPITPSKYYQEVASTSVSTDPFGLTTTTKRTTAPVDQKETDLSKFMQLDESGNLPSGQTQPTAGQTVAPQAASPAVASQPVAKGPGAPSPAIGTKPGQRRTEKQKTGTAAIAGTKSQKLKQIAAQARSGSQLDASGHIPSTEKANSMLVSAANQLIDGMDISKLALPQKDRQAAAELAAKYGWRQGMFTPREMQQVSQSSNLINSLRNNKSVMSVFDEGTIKRAIISSAIYSRPEGGIRSNLAQVLINKGLNGKEVEFVEDMRNLIGRIQGLAQLTRGSGRPVEASVERMMAELPNVLLAKNQKEAQHAFDLIQDEINIAMKGGKTGGGKTSGGKNNDPLGVL